MWRSLEEPWYINKQSLTICNLFIAGEFATQTCFQGRFGEETGWDQMGAQVIIHSPEPDTELSIARIEYVEFTHVGQAFRLGR